MSTSSQKSSLTDWLASIENAHPISIDLELSRVAAVADSLGLRSWITPVVTIAGTNGKGSTLALLATILIAHDYRVGTFSSPHLMQFNERIQIQQQSVTDAAIVKAFIAIEQAAKNITLTYFEYSFLAALYIFKQHPLDIIILEVGMGGRLDAVNILDADIALLTAVDLDHQAYLGDTREAIGFEKAGIFRHGKPVLCGEYPPESVLAHARDVGAPIQYPYRDFYARQENLHWSFISQQQSWHELPYPQIPFNNAVLVLAALQRLTKWFCFQADKIRESLHTTKVMGRWQCIERAGVSIILDVAHNPHAMRYLAQRLEKNAITGKTALVFAMLEDKNIEESFSALRSHVDQVFLAGLPGKRGSDVMAISAKLQLTNDCCFSSVNAAYAAAVAMANPGDRILVTGSFHTVAAVLTIIF